MQHGYYIPTKPNLGTFGPFDAGSHEAEMGQNGHGAESVKLFRWSSKDQIDAQLSIEAS